MNSNQVDSNIGAFFDLEKTLIKKNLFSVFLKFAINKKFISPIKLPWLIILFILSKVTKSNTPIRQGIYWIVSGLNKQEITAAWKDYLILIINNLLIEETLIRLKDHHIKAHFLVMLTNNLDFIIEPIKLFFNFNLVVSLNTYETEEGTIFKHMSFFKSIGLNKEKEVIRICDENKLVRNKSYGYGDSQEDIGFLKQLGNAYIIKNCQNVIKLNLI